ncbi:hypothetical protein GCM10009555_020520 [Acrocarpospora macrocephala]|uniref:Uncharacterized protein n=1 Tax=Acrocarpospora macrocephala TaxID=150177 RepID=A0A5M3WNP1_9ACTN|nr:hypothetical protein Amac_015430 [Acrocarpospora macrocephala]
MLNGHSGDAVGLGQFDAGREFLAGFELLGEDRRAEGVGHLLVRRAGVIWVETHTNQVRAPRLARLVVPMFLTWLANPGNINSSEVV